jgi:hypothetical protein
VIYPPLPPVVQNSTVQQLVVYPLTLTVMVAEYFTVQ